MTDISEPSRDAVEEGMEQTREHMAEMAESASERLGEWTATAREKMPNATGTASGKMTDLAEAGRSTLNTGSGEAGTWAKETAASAEEKASSAYSTTKSRASSMAAAAKGTATRAYEGVASTADQAAAALTASASGITRSSTARARIVVKFCADHPLLLAGLGLALGAVLGAAIPNTEAEDRLMGESSDSIKEQAQDVAQKQFERAKAAGQAVVDIASHQAEHLGLKGQSGEATSQQPDPVSARETVVPSLDAGVLPLQDAGMEPEEEQAHQQT